MFKFPIESHCNIRLYQVTSNTGSLTRRERAPLARLLAFVLLAFVAYSATAESVHRHGVLLLAVNGSSAPAISSSEGSGPLANDSRANGECLICQLRQQLSFSLINAPSQNIATQIEHALVDASALPSLSQTGAPQRGRAPPLTSLS